MKRLTTIMAAVAQLTLAGQAAAQGPQGQGGGLVSPEVNADRRITLRIRAPKADSVSVNAETFDSKPAPAMTRDTAGVWSVTLGPLAPDIYTYAFRVDGVSTPDPLNPYLKPPAT